MSRFFRLFSATFMVAALLMGLVGMTAVVGDKYLNAQTQTVAYSTDVPDADFDYWSQIIQHRIPEIQNGAIRYFPGGKYYLGKNGLEIRLTNRASQLAIAAVGGSTASFGNDIALLTPMVRTAVQMVSPAVRDSAAAVAGTGAGFILPGDQCLGLTLPPIWVAHYLNNSVENLQAVTNGQIPVGFGYNVPVWLESCG